MSKRHLAGPQEVKNWKLNPKGNYTYKFPGSKRRATLFQYPSEDWGWAYTDGVGSDHYSAIGLATAQDALQDFLIFVLPAPTRTEPAEEPNAVETLLAYLATLDAIPLERRDSAWADTYSAVIATLKRDDPNYRTVTRIRPPQMTWNTRKVQGLN